MSQQGFTPIYLYSSLTSGNVPSAASLGTGELAINIPDGKLFYKNGSNVLSFPSSVNPTLIGILEPTTVTAAAPAATVNFYAQVQAVQYFTVAATANFTLNFAGNSALTLNNLMSVGQSLSLSVIVTNGTTAYYPNVIQIDGVAVTPKWQGGTAPIAGDASALDVYNFVIIKTAASTYTVLGAQSQFA
jgi:hypothetical protein